MYRSSEVGMPPVSFHLKLKRSPPVALNITAQYQHTTYDVPISENEYTGIVCPDTGDEPKLPATTKISRNAIVEFFSRMRISAVGFPI